ncbi:MAG TPA: hypothetical protein VMR81_01800 [Patescibacteria group bacterium]|nr:hypothetical protein [Patescibacteria group bacterium]
MKNIRKSIITIALLLIPFIAATTVYADENVSDPAANVMTVQTDKTDPRIPFLQSFLRSYNSPLESDAATFIHEADKNGLDWRLVVAISGVESTFGQSVPPGSYNAWGWGIPTGADSGVGFSNWKDGIATVSYGLKHNYMDKGEITLDAIGQTYAASGAWSGHVQYFIDKINFYTPQDTLTLDITL